MNEIRVPFGNDFTVSYAICVDGEPLQASSLENLCVTYGCGDSLAETSDYTLEENLVLVHFPATLAIGGYNVHITGIHDGRNFASHFRNIRVVRWNDQSDFDASAALNGGVVHLKSADYADLLALLKSQQNTIAALTGGGGGGSITVDLSEATGAVSDAKEDILAAVANISVDTSGLAKQGTDAAVTLTGLAELIGHTINQIDNA